MSERLEFNLGLYIIETLYEWEEEFDLIDCYEVCKQFLPPNYIVSRDNYFLTN